MQRIKDFLKSIFEIEIIVLIIEIIINMIP
jgi:hypothetical protein